MRDIQQVVSLRVGDRLQLADGTLLFVRHIKGRQVGLGICAVGEHAPLRSWLRWLAWACSALLRGR